MEKIVKSGERVTHVTLDGTECAVRFSAEYRVFYVKSEGSEVLVSLRSGAVRGDDGTLICPSGGSVGYPHMRQVNTVYLTGTGDVTVFAGNEADAAPFKSAAQGGGAASGSGVSQSYVDSRDNAILDAAKKYADSAAEKINVKNAIACDEKPIYADGSITYVKGGITYTTADTETWFYYNDGEELKQTIFVDGEEFTITSAGKVDFTEFVADSDVVSTYTGDEGDTSKIPDLAALRMLDAKITGNISNPNLLINPDFSINQRGAETVAENYKYGPDRWLFAMVGSDVTGSYNANTRTLTCDVKETSGYYANVRQFIENSSKYNGKTITFSVDFERTENNCMIQIWLRRSAGTTTPLANTAYSMELEHTLTVKLPNDIADDDVLQVVIQTRGVSVVKYAKLEIGSLKTPDSPYMYATELTMCQRYYQVYSSGYINLPDLRPTMRTTPTITQLTDSSYAYDAEIY